VDPCTGKFQVPSLTNLAINTIIGGAFGLIGASFSNITLAGIVGGSWYIFLIESCKLYIGSFLFKGTDMSIKKIRIILTYINGFLYFIVFQLIEATATGEKATFFESLIVGLFISILLLGLFSDWMYYNHLIDQSAKIKYETYQNLGLGVVIFSMYIIFAVVFNSLYHGELGILSIFIAIGIIYIFVKFLSSVVIKM
jgi:hypothetical protein